MAGYLSPATFQTPNDWHARGPLGGFLAGMNQDISNQIVQREFNQDDVDLASRQNQLALDQGSLNDKLDQSHEAGTKARYDKEQYDSGNKAQEDMVARGIKKAQLDTDTMKNDDEAHTQAAYLWNDMANELQQRGGKIDFMNSDDRDWYEGWRTKMKKYAPNMPSAIGQDGIQNIMMQGQKSQQYLAMKNNAAQNGLAFTQKKAVDAVAPNIHAAAQVQAAQVGADSRVEGAMIRADAARDVAEAKAEVARLSKKEEERASMNLDRLNKSPQGVLTANGGDVPFNIQQAEESAAYLAKSDLEKDFLGYKVLADSKDPAKKDQAAQMLKEATTEKLKGVKGYAEAKGKTTGNTVTPAAAAPNAAPSGPQPAATDPMKDVQASATSAFGSYDPAKWTYGVNPATGKFARKPK